MSRTEGDAMYSRTSWLLTPIMMAVFVLPARADDKPENVAVKAAPRLQKEGNPDPNWMKRHGSFVAMAKKGGVDVLFLGDSITDAWGGEGHPRKASGAEIFEKQFMPLKAANFGIGGDQTQHVLWRLQNG